MKATRNTVTDALKALYKRLKVCFYAYGNKTTIYANSDFVLFVDVDNLFHNCITLVLILNIVTKKE